MLSPIAGFVVSVYFAESKIKTLAPSLTRDRESSSPLAGFESQRSGSTACLCHVACGGGDICGGGGSNEGGGGGVCGGGGVGGGVVTVPARPQPTPSPLIDGHPMAVAGPVAADSGRSVDEGGCVASSVGSWGGVGCWVALVRGGWPLGWWSWRSEKKNMVEFD